jgi:hypothetical protein
LRQRSRERRHQRKVAREQRRLALALAMVQEAQERLALLLPPPRLVIPPLAEPEQIRQQGFNPSRGLMLLPEQMEAPLRKEVGTEVDRLLGLHQSPTSPPSSES